MPHTKHLDSQKAEDQHREHVLRHGPNISNNHRVPIGSGKSGAAGKVGTIQALKEDRCFYMSSDRKSRTRTLTCLERDAASGDRKRDVQRVVRDLSGRCG